MNTRLTIAAAGTAAALIAAGSALALPAVAGGTTHTLRFTAVSQSQAGLGKHAGVGSDHDVAGGKVIGYDVLTFTGRVNADVALGVKGGFLYGTLTFAKSGALTGKVTGGTGPYAGATGSISGQAASKHKTMVTITYHS